MPVAERTPIAPIEALLDEVRAHVREQLAAGRTQREALADLDPDLRAALLGALGQPDKPLIRIVQEVTTALGALDGVTDQLRALEPWVQRGVVATERDARAAELAADVARTRAAAGSDALGILRLVVASAWFERLVIGLIALVAGVAVERCELPVDALPALQEHRP